jgi:hypothetical protein
MKGGSGQWGFTIQKYTRIHIRKYLTVTSQTPFTFVFLGRPAAHEWGSSPRNEDIRTWLNIDEISIVDRSITSDGGVSHMAVAIGPSLNIVSELPPAANNVDPPFQQHPTAIETIQSFYDYGSKTVSCAI